MVTNEGEMFSCYVNVVLVRDFFICKRLVSLMADHEEFFNRLPWDSTALIYIL